MAPPQAKRKRTEGTHFNQLEIYLNVDLLTTCRRTHAFLKTVSLDYIPEPAAGASTLKVMADVHQRFDDVDSGEVEVLDSTQKGNQATQF